MKFRHKSNGEVYEPAPYENGRYRLMLEFDCIEDFERFSKIAHSARLLKLSNGEKNVISFSELEEF